MKSTSIAVASLAVAVSASFPPPKVHYNRYAPRQSTIDWQPCFDNDHIQCGHFDVPLDYTNPAAGKATLAVIRYVSTATPRLGSIFTNPGGPGGSGVGSISGGTGEYISKITGGQYDIVSWDPRGVNGTLPSVKCFNTATEERAFWEGTIPDAGLEARGNFTDQVDLDYFFSQVDEVDAKLKELHDKCVAMSGDVLKYVGTVAVVKDMLALSDYLEKPNEKINYWGFSYGTVIGSYLANMYPDRVGRVVIDGVVNPVYWAERPAHLLWGDSIQSTDEALEGFALACGTAGPAGCALALTPTTTPPDILTFIRNLLDKAYDYYHAGYSGGYKSSVIRGYILNKMYSPSSWVELAELLLEVDEEITEALAGNPTKKRALAKLHKLHEQEQLRRGVLQMRQDGPAPDYSFQAITCADAIDAGAVTTKDVFDELVRVTREVSQTFGPTWGDAGFYCHRWTSRATERFQGPWNHVLANPILVIGNEADPITPFASAKFVADTLGDSATLVEQDDYGHCSLALHSTCTIDIVSKYFLKGELPTTDQFCGTDAVLFPGPGVTKASLDPSRSGVQGTSGGSSDKLNALEKEKKTLFYVVIALGAAVVLLIIGMIVQFILHRRNPRGRTYTRVDGAQATSGPKGGYKDVPAPYGSSYSDPYDPHHKSSHA